ncbi:hypothetical protein QTO34_006549 [Cnephaeus nilssonii]|uniref:Uncharacterized protein n=1 Tax=Cnephaeus nilssonii TaxID=3371016 RepID=A0AA40LGT1_CNENI|nr:hypothetical protein QTO34_006549 [Eptesicus nilssonii]
MGTYLILRMMETKMPGRKVKVRPYRSPDSSDISSSYEAAQPSDEGLKRGLSHLMGGLKREGSQPSDGGAEESSILPHYLWFNVTGPPPSLESMTTPPPLESVEFGTAPPSPDLQLGPGGSPPTHSRRLHSSSSSIRGAAPEGAAPESCRQAGQPEGSTPASSSAHSQGRPGLARRAFRAFLKFTCCGLPTRKRRSKRNKVHPITVKARATVTSKVRSSRKAGRVVLETSQRLDEPAAGTAVPEHPLRVQVETPKREHGKDIAKEKTHEQEGLEAKEEEMTKMMLRFLTGPPERRAGMFGELELTAGVKGQVQQQIQPSSPCSSSCLLPYPQKKHRAPECKLLKAMDSISQFSNIYSRPGNYT